MSPPGAYLVHGSDMLQYTMHFYHHRLMTLLHVRLFRMDLMGFSFSWELDYRNILTLLEAANLPLLATERDPSAPLVFGGGPVLTANPEPYALFFDVVLLGDGEDLLRTFVDAYAATGGVAACTTDAQRTQLLTALAQVPGVYVPRLYDVCYDGHEGHITSIQPLHRYMDCILASWFLF